MTEVNLIPSSLGSSFLQERKWCDARIRYETEADAYDEDIAQVRDHSEDDSGDDADDDSVVHADETFHFSFGDTIDIQLQGCAQDSNQIYKSTGMTCWRSSQHLCNYLTDHADELVHNRRILELGSGLGLCGMVAHRLEAAKVILTDGDSDVLHQLRSNLQLNNIHEEKNQSQYQQQSSSSTNKSVSCHQLLWGQASSQAFLKHYCPNQQPVDLILASDVIYTPVVIRPLWQTVKTLLHPTRGIFLMSYESKRQISVSLEDVLSPAREMGLECECLLERPQEGIFVWQFSWKQS